MNSRQTFYSLSFVDEFSSMGWKKPYMIHTMTDETYAVNCTLEVKDAEKKQFMLPALIIVSMLLVWYNSRKQVAVE